MTQEEVESTLRPWLGIEDVRLTEDGYVLFLMRNTGSIPARVVRMQYFYSDTMITQEQLRSGEDIPGKVAIFPNINRTIRLVNFTGEYQYIGLLIQYEYAKTKHGEVGLVVRYYTVTKKFDYLEHFAN